MDSALSAEEVRQAKRPPKESERWLRSVVQNTSEIIVVLDADATIRYVNPAVEMILGHKSEELLGIKAFDLVHPEDTEHARRSFFEARRNSGVQPLVTFRLRHADGSWRHVEVARNNLLNDPIVGGIVSNVRDVTERKQAEQALKDSEERFRKLTEATFEAIAIHEKGKILEANDRFCATFGYDREEVIGMNALDFAAPESRDLVRENVLSGNDEPYEAVGLRKDGTLLHGELRGMTVTYRGRSARVTAIRDVTGRKRAEEALRRSEGRFRQLFEHSVDALFVIHPETRAIVDCNREACRALGYSREELLALRLDDFAREILSEKEKRQRGGNTPWRRALAGEPGTIIGFHENQHRRKDGTTFPVEVGVGSIDYGERRMILASVRDITERKRAAQRLHYQATHDLLTGLPNRSLFADRLEHALRRTRGRMAAVLFMDLDNFKVVNDSLGHELGDRLLVAASERFGGCLRPEDTLARFGGDEFTVLVDDLEHPEDAVRIARRIMEAYREPFVLEGQEIFIKPSIGVSLSTDRAPSASSEELLRDADIAMYRAKKEGLGCRLFEPVMHEQVLRRLKLENELRRAIELEDFVVHYQPIVDLRSGGVWGVEALARWQHPERGLLDPEEFIPAAEESGLVVPIGEFLLKQACEHAKGWQERHPHLRPLVVSVNLSARQLRRPDLARIVEGVLRETNLEASSLSLDITETDYVRAMEDNIAVLDDLKRLGVHISIDDFGVGYSSLSYLKRLPADDLKLDQSFVAGVGANAKDTAIVRTVIGLAHTLGMRVIAEGVESAEQAAQLSEMGCELAQGYHFSEPLPNQALLRFLGPATVVDP